MIESGLPLSSTPAHTGRIHMMGAKSTALTQAQSRGMLIALIVFSVYALFAIRAFDLMILQGSLVDFRGGAGLNQNLTATPTTLRRDIVDRNGLLLATSIKITSLYADPKSMIDIEGAAKGLAAIFPDQNAGDLVQKLTPNKRFVWIKRNLTPKEQAAVLELGQPGLNFQEEYRRLYPHGNLTAHMVGYSDIDTNGLSGIEKSFNTVLSRDDAPLALTLDVRLQHILHREIQKTMDDFSSIGGSGVILDAKTGDVLAAVSLPDFDPHAPGQAKDKERFNRVTLGTYELGSTFKIFTTAALFEQKNPALTTLYDTREPIKVGRYTISDYHPENRKQTIAEVFMHSSNIGTAMMAQDIGTDGLREFFDRLGLFAPIAFDIPEMGSPLLPKPWRDVSTLTASYGHGIAVTPLHLASATASIVGDGTLVQPRLVAPTRTRTETRERIASERTVDMMRGLMRLVVTNGTGSKADVPGMMVGGKTGTAEKNVGGRYIRTSLLSSFVGAFPMNDPRYVIAVTIDEPKPNKSSYGFATAGWTAAPAVGRVIAGMQTVLGLAPITAKDPAEPFLAYINGDVDQKETETNQITGGGKIASVTPVP